MRPARPDAPPPGVPTLSMAPLPCPWRCWFDPSKATSMSDIADSSNMIPTSDYREHAPVAALDRHVACVWTQRIGPGSTPLSPGSLVVGVRFRPGLAPTMLGLPASELIDDRVDLDLLWGRAAGRLAGRLGDAAGPGAAVRLLEGELVERLPGAAPVDPFVEAVVAELPAGPPTPATPTRRTWPGSAAASAVSRHGGCSADGHRQPASVRPVGPAGGSAGPSHF